MDLDFTYRTFTKVEKRAQHKRCAMLLRLLYEELLETGIIDEKKVGIYSKWTSWLKLPPFSSWEREEVANRYHFHLSSVGLQLKEHNLLPHIRKGDHTPKKEFGPYAIYLDNLRSAYNVGSILRTVEALRVGSVHFGKNTPFIDNPKVEKIAMGAAALVPCFQHTDLSTLPRPLIAVDTSDEAISVHDHLFPEQGTLILGNEELGVSEESLRQADYLVEIPLYGAKNSINVASAFTAIAVAMSRQNLSLQPARSHPSITPSHPMSLT